MPTAVMVPAALVATLAYLVGAQQLFAHDGTWVPLFVTVLIQAPFALLGALLWRYRTAHQEQRKMRHVLGHYMPPELVDELARGNLELAHKGELIFGVCLATDAEQYTRLSEKLRPEALHSFLSRYYQILFAAVRHHDGIVSDVTGDAMLAIWAAGERTLEAREKACRAAWEIHRRVAAFNDEQGHLALPTRIGVHCGQIMLGNVGAGDHYEYRAVGDSVNTADRIQGLNKTLGTRILVSAEVVEGSEQVVTRPLGRFRLTGKTETLSIHELVRIGASAEDYDDTGDALLRSGLDAFATRRWNTATNIFRRCLALRSADGPARFYLWLCAEYQRNPPPSTWDGVVQVDKK
jgi:adenylate cyclase